MERDAIRSHGDLVEKHIFGNEDFASALHLYPVIWNRYVHPNREVGGLRVVEEWRGFAQHHYAAIVRCWGMFGAKNAILEGAASWSGTTESILRLQSELVAYYAFNGSVIDNLNKCFAALDDPTDVKNLGRFGTSFDRRNTEVHDGIRPIFDLDGTPVFDVSLYAEQHRLWEDGLGDLTSLHDWIMSEWSSFIGDASSAWSQLLSCLQRTRPPRTPKAQPPDVDLPPGMSPAVSGQPEF